MSYSVIWKPKLRAACEHTVKTIREERKQFRENMILNKMEEWNKERAKYWKWLRVKPFTREQVEKELESRDSWGWPIHYHFHYLSNCYNSVGLDTACDLLRLMNSTDSGEVNLSTEDSLNLIWP